MKISTRLFSILLLFLSVTTKIQGQKNIQNIDPPHWWNEMQNDSLFILLKGVDLDVSSVEIKEDGLQLLSFRSTDKYVFLYLKVINCLLYTSDAADD